MKKTVIEIDGRRYDARSGQRLDAPVHSGRPKHHAAKHVRPHAPTASKLLMRQAVKKPAAADRRLKAQGALAARSLSDLTPASRAEKRLTHAKHVHISPLVSHFGSPAINAYTTVPPPAAVTAAGHSQPITVHLVAPAHRAVKRPQTTAELLETALQAATSHEAEPLPRPKHRLFSRRLHTAS